MTERLVHSMPSLAYLSLPPSQEYQTLAGTEGAANFIKKFAAGPLVEDDGKYMIGSFFLVEATLEEAKRFVDNDPFNKVKTHVPRPS